MLNTRDVCTGPSALTKDDRAKIISRIHSLLFWVGEMVPQEIEEEGRSIHLRDVVFRYLTDEHPTDEDRREAAALAELLDRHVQEIEAEIKGGDINRTQACALMNEARSYLRAVDELLSAKGEEAEVKRQDLMARVEDARRWKHFVDKVR
jgi:hypothetical protein